jgi:hypothetical protein
LVENISLGQPGVPFDGEVGMKFTAEQDVKVTALGRFYYTGNTGVHKLTLYDAQNGKVVAESTVDMSEGKADYNGFKYAVLSDPVTITAGNSYYLTTEEKTDGDWWLEETCRVIPSEVFVVEGNVIKTVEGFTSPSKPGADHTAGPVNLLFER